MVKNIGGFDRILRIVIGAGLVVFALVTGKWWGFIGVIPLLTAFIGWCPLYVPFGIRTCPLSNKSNAR